MALSTFESCKSLVEMSSISLEQAHVVIHFVVRQMAASENLPQQLLSAKKLFLQLVEKAHVGEIFSCQNPLPLVRYLIDQSFQSAKPLIKAQLLLSAHFFEEESEYNLYKLTCNLKKDVYQYYFGGPFVVS